VNRNTYRVPCNHVALPGRFPRHCRGRDEPHDVRLRRSIRASAYPLDVVASNRRSRNWRRRPLLSSGLGVGYDYIAELLHGSAPLLLIIGILLAKSIMWAFSLGSGTSGGVLASLLMIGGTVGALAGHLAHALLEIQAGAAETMAAEAREILPVVNRRTGKVCRELALKDLLRGGGRSVKRESERLRLFS
jgi:hypothetical protein